MWSSVGGSSSSYGGGETNGDIRSRISGVFDSAISRIKALPVSFLMQYRSVPTSEAAARLQDRFASSSRYGGGTSSSSGGGSGSSSPVGKRSRLISSRFIAAVLLLVVGCVVLVVGLRWVAQQRDAGFALLLFGVMAFVPGIYISYEVNSTAVCS